MDYIKKIFVDNEFMKNFYEVMEAALGKDIQIKIRQIGKEIKNGNNNTK